MSGTSTRRHNPWAAFSILAVTQFMVVLDASIVYVALPSIQRDLGFAAADLAWVMDAYILTFGGIMMLGGRAGDLLGRRRVLLLGLIWFGVASLACGLATEAWHIVVARGAQGLGAAFIAPAALALVTDTFPEGPSRFRALGIFASIGGFGGAAGTLLGGLLTAVAWQWAFLINIPIVIVVLVLGVRLLAAQPPAGTGGVDLIGVLTSTGGLCLLLLGLLRGGVQGWSEPAVLLAFLGAAVLLVAFVLRQATAAQPLVPRLLFRMRGVVLGNGANIVAGAMLFGVFLVLTLHLQLARGHTPLQAALWTMPISVCLFLGSNLVSRMFARIGPINALGGALALQAVALAWWSVALSADGPILTSFVLPGMVWSLGCGAAIVSAFVVCTNGVDGPVMGAASGLVSTTLQVGGALGVAVLSMIAHHGATTAGAPLAELSDGQSAALLTAAVVAALGVPLMLWLRAGARAVVPQGDTPAFANAGSADDRPTLANPDISRPRP
ncbi:MFS transporter [Plantactinospora sp. B5E13]|uniref:MFS transporter n=1 Tax=unclassified Plantactinospora TaxID=2631981 RepID=UPI00325F39F0